MLNPRKNRLDYGAELVPPDGYELSLAVGTTYSLDLQALMALPVALLHSRLEEWKPEELRYEILDAITNASSKIKLFYQNGQLKVPRKYHRLMAFWEESIYSVTMPIPEASFHPKVWVVRYTKKDAATAYRVLVTSRNLTFTRDWDVALSSVGYSSDSVQSKNQPLLDFIGFLQSHGESNIPPEFLSELSTVKFVAPERFESLDFLPMGIGKEGGVYGNPITAKTSAWDDMLIISPFVDKTTLDRLDKVTSKRKYLLSRPEELDGVDAGALASYDCWSFNPFFELAESFEELAEEGVAATSHSLHAKLFVTSREKKSYWFLGSANCTAPAQDRNIEFMVRLRSSMSGKGVRPKELHRTLTQSDGDGVVELFQEYKRGQDSDTVAERQIDDILRRLRFNIGNLPLQGIAEGISDSDHYSLTLIIDATQLHIPEPFGVTVRPLPEEHKAPVQVLPGEVNHITKYNSYPVVVLSKFLVFSIEQIGVPVCEFMLPMRIELPDGRLNRIFRSIIDSHDKFIQYITFLLTGEESGQIDAVAGDVGLAHSTPSVNNFLAVPLYEKLLVAASRYPERLGYVDALIERLKLEEQNGEASILTSDFLSFWAVFKAYSTPHTNE